MNKEVRESIEQTKEIFARFDEISLYNQNKVIEAFCRHQIALRHFNGTTGYGTDDVGRQGLCRVLADIFEAPKALVSPLIATGTAAISTALFGVLRPGDAVLSVTGMPYDTLTDVVFKEGIGSLKDFGVQFEAVSLTDNGDFDYDCIQNKLGHKQYKMVYIQRSRGYSWRPALSIEQIGTLCKFVKKASPNTVIFCDNCYGEFVERHEPTAVGVDLCAGSFIKNIGGGLAPTGGYVAGQENLVDLVAGRLTAPSTGMEVGSYQPGYRLFYQGIFMAPHTVNQALKVSTLFSYALARRGYEVAPRVGDRIGDIVCSVKLGDEDKMVKFCRAVQSISPIDGYVKPEPWQQAGYSDKVIMAAGCFVEGASIELSCDGPIRAPYVIYLQGGLTLEHGILALERVLESL